MKAAVLLTFLSVLTSPAFAADTKIATTGYVGGAVEHVKQYTNEEIAKNKLTQGTNVKIENNTISVANATQTTAGVVKYGTIPTSSSGSGEALIWVE
ncbi:MAG: hypothetical protein II238_05160 [Alphaproteobacteria bacterium]|nr:hypothetical protein [Alphaproteobacteria bacterium]